MLMFSKMSLKTDLRMLRLEKCFSFTTQSRPDITFPLENWVDCKDNVCTKTKKDQHSWDPIHCKLGLESMTIYIGSFWAEFLCGTLIFPQDNIYQLICQSKGYTFERMWSKSTNKRERLLWLSNRNMMILCNKAFTCQNLDFCKANLLSRYLPIGAFTWFVHMKYRCCSELRHN